MSRPLILVLFLAGALCSTAHAQSSKVPRRPKLDGADTSSSRAYYTLGVQLLPSRPKQASEAFYWAIRLDPRNTMAYSGRRVAMLKENESVLWRYLSGDRKTRESKEMLHLDSLELISRSREPFLVRPFEIELLRPFIDDWMDVRSQADVGFLAWLKLLEGDYAGSARDYGIAAKRYRRVPSYHNMRALALYQMGKHDSAETELGLYLAALRKDDKDKKKTVLLYESKAMTEYMIGLLQARQGRVAEAREAYGRALLEDLSFYMAHVRLADASLALDDTAAALTEYALAVEAGGEDATVRIGYGERLMDAKRPAEAAEQFRKAIEAEPYFADGYYLLGRALDADGKDADAAKAYADFARFAVREDARREWVQERLAQASTSSAP